MKIQLLKSVAGTGFDGKPYSYAKGATVEVPDKLGADLCLAGNAKPIGQKGASKRSKRSPKFPN